MLTAEMVALADLLEWLEEQSIQVEILEEEPDHPSLLEAKA